MSKEVALENNQDYINVISGFEALKARVLTFDNLAILEDGKPSKMAIKSLCLEYDGDIPFVLVEEYVVDEDGVCSHSTMDEDGELCHLTKKTKFVLTENSEIKLTLRRAQEDLHPFKYEQI